VAWSQAAIDKVISLSVAVVGFISIVLYAGLAKDNTTAADVISWYSFKDISLKEY